MSNNIMPKSSAERSVWSNDNSVKYYANNRNTISALYPSEKHFLDNILTVDGISILDVGCAAGGFYDIFSEYNMTIKYTGVDLSEELISVARDKHPCVKFVLGNGDTLPFDTESFDLVFCSGVLHMNSEWINLFNECWRVTKSKFLFDVRITNNGLGICDKNTSYQKISFENPWDGKSTVPYVVLSVKEFETAIDKLDPSPANIDSFGYFHEVSDMVVCPYNEVCMSMFLLQKDGSIKNKAVGEWDIPIDNPWG